MPHENPERPLGAETEGMTISKTKGGRPHNKPPMDSVLRVLKGIEEQAVESKADLDYALVRKYLACYMAITLERALLARDTDMPIKSKADLVARLAPVMVMFEAMVPKEGTRHPKTADAVDGETVSRQMRMKKLMDKGVDPGIDAMIATMAPAAAQPAEEA